jgi:tRNA1Val (adenine37-N6)-methyltransferase
MSDFFKGWAKPGPRVPGELDSPLDPMVNADVSCDGLSGHFRIFQLKGGHRFSTDDLLAAWYGTSHAPCARTVLDLGSGIGTVGMIAAWRLPGARLVTIEAQSESVELARRSARYNGLTERYEIREGDFRAEGVLRPDEKFDLVLGSPPYFPLGSGMLAEHPQKIACRFEVRGTVADYCATAARHLSLGGWFACVFPVNDGQLQRVRDGARAAGLTIVRYRPVVLRAGEPPLIGVFAMVRSDHLPEAIRGREWVDPNLLIRCADGSIHPEYSAVKMSIGFPP